MKSKVRDIIKLLKKNSKKYFSTNVLFSTYVITSLLIGFFVRVNTVGSAFSLKPLLIDFTLVLIIGSFGYLFKPKNQFKYFLICSLFFTFLGVANTIYYEFYHSFISVNLLATLKMLGEVDDSMTAKFKITQIIYLWVPIILIIVNRKLRKKNYYFEVGKIEKGKQMFLRTGAIGLGLLMVMVATFTSMESSRFIKQWNREYIVQRFGLYIYTFNDLAQSIQPKINSLFGYEESARKFRNFYKDKIVTEEKKDNKYTDLFKGKNVIFIHAESIQNFLIDLKINNQAVTPTINKIAKEGIYFSKFYPQISVGTSSDTEFTLQTGLMPSSSGTVFVSYSDREYKSMSKYFADLGYYTFSMHGNNADYWNRKVMHKKLGYQRFYAKDTYDTSGDNLLENDWLADKSFFKQIIPILSDIKETKTPYMSTIITLTNHSPFKAGGLHTTFNLTLPYKHRNEKGELVVTEREYLEDTDMGNYLKSAHYADEALNQFFNDLETNGLLEDTVIILYGDHEAKLAKKEFDLLYNYDITTGEKKDKEDPTYISMENYAYDLLKNTPLIIWTKDTKFKKEVKDVMGMYDVLPTISNLFGFDTTYELGHDIFSNNEKVVIFPNGNFLTNKVFYNNFKDDYISLTNEPIESDYIERLKNYTEERLEISNSIIVYDLIRKEGNKILLEE